jgi:hypothetical protein
MGMSLRTSSFCLDRQGDPLYPFVHLLTGERSDFAFTLQRKGSAHAGRLSSNLDQVDGQVETESGTSGKFLKYKKGGCPDI